MHVGPVGPIVGWNQNFRFRPLQVAQSMLIVHRVFEQGEFGPTLFIKEDGTIFIVEVAHRGQLATFVTVEKCRKQLMESLDHFDLLRVRHTRKGPSTKALHEIRGQLPKLAEVSTEAEVLAVLRAKNIPDGAHHQTFLIFMINSRCRSLNSSPGDPRPANVHRRPKSSRRTITSYC